MGGPHATPVPVANSTGCTPGLRHRQAFHESQRSGAGRARQAQAPALHGGGPDGAPGMALGFDASDGGLDGDGWMEMVGDASENSAENRLGME